ncbi:MAG: energy transducer TonB, partial [Gemmatimonadaceae bacterium]
AADGQPADDVARSDADGSADAGTRRGALPLPTIDSERISRTMRAVESSTVRPADSAIRRVLFGSALALTPERSESTATSGDSSRLRERSATRPSFAEPTFVRPAALAPGTAMPQYPPALRSAPVEGRVLIELVVDADGRAALGTVRVVHSDNPLFTKAVLETLPDMRFVPAEADGRRVPQQLQLPFTFTRQADDRSGSSR